MITENEQNVKSRKEELQAEIAAKQAELAAIEVTEGKQGSTYCQLMHDANKVLGLVKGAIYSEIYRLAHLDKGYCCASHETIALNLGVHVSTVDRNIPHLIKDGYLKDLTPDRKNKTHHASSEQVYSSREQEYTSRVRIYSSRERAYSSREPDEEISKRRRKRRSKRSLS